MLSKGGNEHMRTLNNTKWGGGGGGAGYRYNKINQQKCNYTDKIS